MRLPTLHIPLALVGLAAGCTKAEFAPVRDAATDSEDASDIGAGSDATDAGDTSDTSPGPEAKPICPASIVSGCEPAPLDPCDPVCQSGDCDWCTKKCSYVLAADNSGAQAACTSTGTKAVYESCDVSFEGKPQQSDNCAPGSICLRVFPGDTQKYCFTLCRSSIECIGSTSCGPRPLSSLGGEVEVCDPPYDRCGTDGNCCDPLVDTGSGCGANRYCLLVWIPDPTGDSRTVCEYSYGDGRSGSYCTLARDCQTRNVCVNNTCRAVCDSTHPCANGADCVYLGNQYGYCP